MSDFVIDEDDGQEVTGATQRVDNGDWDSTMKTGET